MTVKWYTKRYKGQTLRACVGPDGGGVFVQTMKGGGGPLNRVLAPDVTCLEGKPDSQSQQCALLEGRGWIEVQVD